MLWDQLWKLWDKYKPDEKGQGQTEYAILYIMVFMVVLMVFALGIAVYNLWDWIMAALPF